MMKSYYVYILASRKNGVLYVGVTNDLIRRVWEHKNKIASEFTKAYSVDCLVYAEEHFCFDTAVAREKRLKRWNRSWKIQLIEASNPEWKDLYSW